MREPGEAERRAGPPGPAQVLVEWRLGEADDENMRRVIQLFDQAVRQAGVGHFEDAFPDSPSVWLQAVEGGKHHMGTGCRWHPVHGAVRA